MNRFRRARHEESKQTIFQLLTSGRTVFYHIVQLTSEDTSSYPPAKQLITSCAEVLGQVMKFYSSISHLTCSAEIFMSDYNFYLFFFLISLFTFNVLLTVFILMEIFGSWLLVALEMENYEEWRKVWVIVLIIYDSVMDDSNSSLIVTSTGICEWTWRLSGEVGARSAGVGRAGWGAAGTSFHPKCHLHCNFPHSVCLPWPPCLNITWPHLHVAL